MEGYNDREENFKIVLGFASFPPEGKAEQFAGEVIRILWEGIEYEFF